MRHRGEAALWHRGKDDCPAYRCSKSFPSKTKQQRFCTGLFCREIQLPKGLWRFLISDHTSAFLLSAFGPLLSELTLNVMDILSSINKIEMKMRLGREGKTMTLTHHQTFNQDRGLGVRQAFAHSLSTLQLALHFSEPLFPHLQTWLSVPAHPAGYDEVACWDVCEMLSQLFSSFLFRQVPTWPNTHSYEGPTTPPTGCWAREEPAGGNQFL